jgi:hypothetical protein
MRYGIAATICGSVAMLAAVAWAAPPAPSVNPFDAPSAGISDFLPDPAAIPSLPMDAAHPPATDSPASPSKPGVPASSPATGVSMSPPAAGQNVAATTRCTIAVITQDIGTDDTYLSRMTFQPPVSPASTNRDPSCPPEAASVAARRALDACKQRVTNPYSCVYGDTDHVFDITTDVVDSSPVTSQCISSASNYIAIACEPGAHQENCSVACGGTAAAAAGAARQKCRATHDGDCALLNAAPVRAP